MEEVHCCPLLSRIPLVISDTWDSLKWLISGKAGILYYYYIMDQNYRFSLLEEKLIWARADLVLWGKLQVGKFMAISFSTVYLKWNVVSATKTNVWKEKKIFNILCRNTTMCFNSEENALHVLFEISVILLSYQRFCWCIHTNKMQTCSYLFCQIRVSRFSMFMFCFSLHTVYMVYAKEKIIWIHVFTELLRKILRWGVFMSLGEMKASGINRVYVNNLDFLNIKTTTLYIVLIFVWFVNKQ